MNTIVPWPLAIPTFGGAEALSRRVMESESLGNKPEYALVKTPGGCALKITFVRQRVVCRMEFRGPGEDRLKLVTASAVTEYYGEGYFAVRLDSGSTLAIGVGFDEGRLGYSMRCGPDGRIGGLLLPFSPEDGARIPKPALASYSVNGRILSSWSLLTMVGLCRYRDAALKHILDHQVRLHQECREVLEDISRDHSLRLAGGYTGIFLPSYRLDRVNA